VFGGVESWLQHSLHRFCLWSATSIRGRHRPAQATSHADRPIHLVI
jgi:hypothetical protein